MGGEASDRAINHSIYNSINVCNNRPVQGFQGFSHREAAGCWLYSFQWKPGCGYAIEPSGSSTGRIMWLPPTCTSMYFPLFCPCHWSLAMPIFFQLPTARLKRRRSPVWLVAEAMEQLIMSVPCVGLNNKIVLNTVRVARSFVLNNLISHITVNVDVNV